MMNKKLVSPKKWALLGLSLISWACNDQNSTPPPVTLNSTKQASIVGLKIGESSSIELEGSALTLLAIAEDSRCPINMHCMQEGQISADFKLTRPNMQEETFRLVLKAAQPKLATKTIDGYTIKLEKVEPVLKAGTTIANDDYKINLVIDRK